MRGAAVYHSTPHRASQRNGWVHASLVPCLQREVRLREREQSLMAERTALLEQQSIHAARDEALETLQLKYHLAVCKLKE